MACPGLQDAFDIGLALRNSTLYEQVYVWMHEKDVLNWNYSTRVVVNGSRQTEYATVSYDTYIESPTFFAQMMRNLLMSMHFAIGVRKEVCVDGQTVVETATVSLSPILFLPSLFRPGLRVYYCVIYCHSKVFMVQATRLCNLICGLWVLARSGKSTCTC